jgi:hypothetical protein
MKNIIIIWGNGLGKKELIKRIIEADFEILAESRYVWKYDKEFDGLSKFYNKNKKIIQSKMRKCDTSEFVMYEVIVDDSRHLVLHREDILSVDKTLYKVKMDLRALFNGRDYIHTSDSIQEAADHIEIINEFCELIEEDVDILTDVFDKISDENYVILRNDISLSDDAGRKGGDIDILCESSIDIVSKLSLIGDQHYVSRYYFKSQGVEIQFDIRDINSNYYDRKWAENILKNKVRKSAFYIPAPSDHIFSFLYHIFLHKRLIRNDHVTYLNILVNEYKFKLEKPFSELITYMKNNDYEVPMPLDLSVPMNVTRIIDFNLCEDISMERKIKNLKFKTLRKIKSYVKKIF